MTNEMSYTLVEMLTWQGLGDIINEFRTETLDLVSLSQAAATTMLDRLRVPFTYCWYVSAACIFRASFCRVACYV